jgi:hypothetical protein
MLKPMNAPATSGFVLRTNLMVHRLGGPKEAHVSNHPNDEDLSFHPKKQKSLLGGPVLGTPVARHGAPGFVVGVVIADSLWG